VRILEKIQQQAKKDEERLKKQAICHHNKWHIVCSCCGKNLGSELMHNLEEHKSHEQII
jgi:hypothetical protein